jgi:hypothetical protein
MTELQEAFEFWLEARQNEFLPRDAAPFADAFVRPTESTSGVELTAAHALHPKA